MNGYQIVKVQQWFVVGLSYWFSDVWDVMVMYINIEYILGVVLKFVNIVIFNMVGVVLYWKLLVVWDFGVGYVYMCVIEVNGIIDSVQYYQFNLLQYYLLLKCMGLYLFEVYQYVKGKMFGMSGVGSIVDVIVMLGDGFNFVLLLIGIQFVFGVGIIYWF